MATFPVLLNYPDFPKFEAEPGLVVEPPVRPVFLAKNRMANRWDCAQDSSSDLR